MKKLFAEAPGDEVAEVAEVGSVTFAHFLRVRSRTSDEHFAEDEQKKCGQKYPVNMFVLLGTEYLYSYFRSNADDAFAQQHSAVVSSSAISLCPSSGSLSHAVFAEDCGEHRVSFTEYFF